MAKLNLKVGDLFEGQKHDPAQDGAITTIGHGVNADGLMGAGIAVLFRKKYPQMFQQYKQLCENFGDWLGGRTYLYFDGEHWDGHIANIFSQLRPGANAQLELLVDGVKDALVQSYAVTEKAPHLAIPLIGCGIGGLDWVSEVRPALEQLVEELPESWQITVYSLEPLEDFEV